MTGETAPDFFISYTRSDVNWATWIAVALENAGYSTVSQALDIHPGHDFVHAMHDAATRARRTIAVLSPAFLESQFGEAEWRVAFAADPAGDHGLVVPVMVHACTPTGLLRTRAHINLVGLDEAAALDHLLRGLFPGPRPTHADFPGAPTSTTSATISNLPARHRSFAGRQEVLDELHRRMATTGMAAVLPVEAIHGLGGVGKTELAIEFGHRYLSEYQIAWWVPAEDPAAATAALRTLAMRLGLPSDPTDAGMLTGLFARLGQLDRWLLVYDNAEQPEYLDGLLPASGTGHVIITSRWSVWGRRAGPLRLPVLREDESVQFMLRRLPGLDTTLCARLADLLGNLPLALEEAATYLEATGVDLVEYIDLVVQRSRDLFGAGHAPAVHGGQRTVATVWSLALDRVRVEAPTAEDLLTLLAFLGPEVPRRLPRAAPRSLPADLGAAVADTIQYNAMIAALGRYSVVTVEPETLGVHRLVAEVVRARLDEEAEARWAATATALLRSACLDEGTTAALPRGALLPHVIAATEHAARLEVAVTDARWLLDWTTRTGRDDGAATATGRFDTLAAAAEDGDPVALEQFLVMAESHVRRFASARLGSYDVVDDVVQDTLLAVTVALRRQGLQGQEALSFVLRTASKVIIDARRSPVREFPMPDIPDRAGPPSLTAGIDSPRLERALAALPPTLHEVIILRVALGYSAEETATIMGTSPGSVRVSQHRALTQLRGQLGR